MGFRTGWRNALYLFAFVAFTAIGAVMFFTGSGTDRLWGLFSMLFFGAGGLAVFWPKGTPPREGSRIVDIVRDGRHQRGLAFLFDTRRQRVRVLAAIAFGAAGALMVIFSEPMARDQRWPQEMLVVVGAAMALFFGGFGLAAALRKRFSGRLVLLQDGVQLDAGASRAFIPWEAIDDWGVVSMYQNDALVFRTTDQSLIEVGPFTRMLLPLNRKLSSYDITAMLDAFVSDADVVVNTVHHYLTRTEDRALLASGRGEPVPTLPNASSDPSIRD